LAVKPPGALAVLLEEEAEATREGRLDWKTKRTSCRTRKGVGKGLR